MTSPDQSAPANTAPDLEGTDSSAIAQSSQSHGSAMSICQKYTNNLDVPFDDIIDWWEEKTKKYKDLAMVRALCLYDRYFLLVQIFGRQDMLHPWLYARCREVERDPDNCLDLWSRFHYKDLADSTPMLTANRGWTTHGELRVGDQVFAPEGMPVKVVAVTSQYTDSECYEIVFQDGAKIIAGAGHLWKLRQKHKLRIANSSQRYVTWTHEVVQTEDLMKSGLRLDVGVAAPLEFPEQQLPIDPYVLGCWLGDGSTGSSRITAGFADVNETKALLESRGVEVSVASHTNGVSLRIGSGVLGKRTSSDFNNSLRDLGIFDEKRIPEIYMQSCIAHRMDLLRGLMDTDGSCDKNGTATFVQVKQEIAEQVYELCSALGLRPRIRHYENGGNGYYQVCFQAHKDRNPFLMKRKALRAINPTQNREIRKVKSVRPVASVPTRCIQVEGGMYLAGKQFIPTHNSTIITYAGVIQEVLNDPEITIGIFSHIKPISKSFLGQVKRELESNVQLKALFPDILYDNPERQSPSWSVDNGLIVKRRSNPKEASISAWGLVDGQPVSAHFRLRVYDDVVTQASVSTPEQVAKTTEAFEQSANLGTENGRRWMAGTRWSYADTYAEIMKRGMAKVRMYPATEDGTFTGKPVLWSETFNEQMKLEQGEAVYATQCLQNPLAGNQKMFNVEDLQVYEVRPETLVVYILIDPARSKKTDSDNTAMVVVGLDYAANKYVLDGFNHKMDLQERWQNTARLYQRWRTATGVQALYVGYESFAAQADLDYFHEQQNLNKLHFPITELSWPREGGGSKVDRVQRLGPDMRSHKIFLPYPTDDKNLTVSQRKMTQGYDYRIARKIKRKDQNNETYDVAEELKSQIFYFPYGGKKDLVDALSRIYDMEPRAPSYREQRYSEPEFV